MPTDDISSFKYILYSLNLGKVKKYKIENLSMEKTDITIIGAGVIGLSAAAQLSATNKNMMLLERNLSFGMETSSRSSEVIHAGIYYAKGSLKGELCIEGNKLMYDTCITNKIPHSNCGKLIVAVTEEQAAQLPELLEMALNNGAEGVRIVNEEEIKKLEPNVKAIAALYCPTSGIVDSHSLMKYYESVAAKNGCDIAYNVEVIAIEKHPEGYLLTVKDHGNETLQFLTKRLVNCAGLESGNISAMLGIDQDKENYRIQYSKGMYFRVTRGIDKFPKMLIYPVPPASGFVGIHTTPDLSGGMRLGPHDAWVDEIEYSVDSSLRQFFFDSVKTFLPTLKIEDLQPEGAGIHPKVQKKGEPMKDWIMRHETERGLDQFFNLVGMESPGITSSVAIGKKVVEMMAKAE